MPLPELGLALRWSEWMTHDRMGAARELDERLPNTWQTLAAGRISYEQAHDIASGTALLDDPEKVVATVVALGHIAFRCDRADERTITIVAILPLNQTASSFLPTTAAFT